MGRHGGQTGQHVVSVGALIQRVNRTLDRQLRQVAVRGELSGVKKATSGHIYFRLKDEEGVLDAAFFRHRASRLDYTLRDGLEVVCRGPLTIFPPQGRIQLVVEELDLVGTGALFVAFEKMMSRLAQEGLFAPEHKKPLPVFPHRIALITSPTGAALRDLLHVLQRRCPSCSVLIASCQVQGQGAARQIVEQIEAVNRQPDVDLIILGRGGGSLEDLWTFNEESVARAIFASRIPILTGVGHETDITIADFVADKRAPTPSAAAEIAVPEEAEWRDNLAELERRLAVAVRRTLQTWRLELRTLHSQLRPPHQRLEQQRRRLHRWLRQMEQLVRQRHHREEHRYKNLLQQLEAHDPRAALAQYRQTWVSLSHRLRHQIFHHLQSQQHRLSQLSQRLNDLSPLATLERGYALAYDPDDRVLHNASDVRPGDSLRVQLRRGSLRATVDETSDT